MSGAAVESAATPEGEATKPDPGRRSGKGLAIGLLVLIAGGVAFALGMWFWGREPHGPITHIAGLDDDQVAVVRQGFEERGYTHLGVWAADGDMVWSEALFGVQDDPGLTVTDELVLVQVTEARGNPALHAFDRETGEFRWKVEQDPAAVDRYTLHADEEQAWFVGPDGEATVVELPAGTVREGASVPASPEAAEEAVYREGERLCRRTPDEVCREVPGLRGYAVVGDVVWAHSETELSVFDLEGLTPR